MLECRFYDDSNDGADASAKTGPRIAQAISPTMHVKMRIIAVKLASSAPAVDALL